uniref:Uncharacterized protein LOC100178305 n=1 Tax=Phallusia mammillata TaxID=59560 RepID=A0A6F9DG41_9ASCI|nr:uncharacterized protein LOC100178305 [Phallusia mammillata]
MDLHANVANDLEPEVKEPENDAEVKENINDGADALSQPDNNAVEQDQEQDDEKESEVERDESDQGSSSSESDSSSSSSDSESGAEDFEEPVMPQDNASPEEGAGKEEEIPAKEESQPDTDSEEQENADEKPEVNNVEPPQDSGKEDNDSDVSDNTPQEPITEDDKMTQENQPESEENNAPPPHDDTNTEEQDNLKEESPENNSVHEDEPPPEVDALHGNNYDSSSSSSSSDDEDAGPLVIRQQPEKPVQDAPDDDLAECLKRALEEREKQQQMQKPPSPAPMNNCSSDEEIDDASLKARTADDFANDHPPALPPKMRVKSNTGPKNEVPNIFHVNDKTASLGRGRWSDDELSPPPQAYKQQRKEPSRSQPDRIIDFSQPQPKNSPKRHRPKHHHQQYDPPNRIIKVPRNANEDINDVYRRQAMVSLHSNVPNQRNGDGSDHYDSVHEDNDDLNRLIKEANRLDMDRVAERKVDPIDVVYPSYNKSLPRQKNLTSAYPEVFAKLAVTDDQVVPVIPVVEPVQFSAIPQGPDLPPKTTRNSQRKRKSLINDDPLPTTRDPLDGDDEISIGESDIKFPTLPSDIPKSLDASQYLSEVYPSDYTDFDSETDGTEIQNHLHQDITPYDTVADLETDFDMPKPKADDESNAIVNDDYQICTALSKSHNTFPRRLKPDKPVPKERASLTAMAIPLTDPSTGPKRRMASLPYHGEGNLKRNKSVPDFDANTAAPVNFFGHVPHIVVTRGPTGSDGDFPTPRNLSREDEPFNKKSKNESQSENDAPQLHFSVGHTTNSDTDATVVGNPNNLQINVLPSDDPNVINLNITTASRVPSSDDAKSPVLFDDPPAFSPLQVQPIVPMTAIAHPPSATYEADMASLTSPQHRVVEMPSILVDTSDLPPPPAPEEPEILPTPLVPEVIIAPPAPVVQQQPIVHHPIEPLVIPVQASAPPITTTRSMVVQTAPEIQQQPNNTVVEIPQPYGGRYRSLPADQKALRHGGDSGIDLTHYDAQQRAQEDDDSDSSSDSEYDMKSTNSKRKLKNADELNRGGLSDKYIEWYKSQYMKPTCCYLFTKHLMFVLNLIFLIIGLALIGLGLWGIIDMMASGVMDVWLVVYDPLFPVFALGVVITLVCFFGAAGFLRDNICLLKCFGSFLVILCFCFVGGGICFWIMKTTIQVFTTNSFVNLVQEYNYTTRKAASFTMDQIQGTFECCGFSAYSDWNTTAEYRCYEDQTCNLPPTCCKLQDTTVPCTTIAGSRHRHGCIDAMSLWARNRTPLLVGVWLGIIVLFFINFGCIYAMAKEIKYLKLVRDKIFSIGETYSDGESRVIFNGNVRPEFELPSQY